MEIYLKGSFWRRFFAFVIDEIIITTFLLLVLSVLLVAGMKIKELEIIMKIKGLEIIIYWFIAAFYNTLMIFKYEATLGKKLFKLKVVTTSYEKVNFGKVLLRETVGKFISRISLNLGYFFALLDEKRRTWHDKIAKTFVVKVDEKGQLIPVLKEEVTIQDRLTFWILFLVFVVPLTPLALLLIFSLLLSIF